MPGRVLIVEDDPPTRAEVRALLEQAGYGCAATPDGEAALATLRNQDFDLVLLDMMLPGMSGADISRELRRHPQTRFLPIVFLSAVGERELVGQLEAGADDFITKPFDAGELLARVGAAMRRSSGLRALSPLSGLPGNITINEEIEKRLGQRTSFALLYADIDRFKAFNDHYGFARGDRLTAQLASLVVNATENGAGERFVGHIGGDDFVVLAPTEEAEALAERITRGFDETVLSLYDAEDRARGYLQVRNRQGVLERTAIATLSIGIVNVTPGRFSGAIPAARAAGEMKAVAKRRPGSAWAVDRRAS